MTTILIVDDKEMMRDSVGSTLARRGHTVVGAPDGKTARESPRASIQSPAGVLAAWASTRWITAPKSRQPSSSTK